MIAGRYEQLEVVGRGGEGTVVRARDERTGVDVALKIRPVPDQQARARMEHEAEILLHVRPHPGLPVIRDAFIEGDQGIIVMSWIEGRSLASILVEEGLPGLAYEQVLDIVDQVADALDHLHGHMRPVVHGDVKPANLIQTPEGRIVLVDFGGALRSGDRLPASGTVGFRAPELAAGQGATIASDIYAFAATAFACFTGRAPRFGVRSRWNTFVGPMAARVESALAAGLAIDPSRRPGKASTLVRLLRSPRGRGGLGPTNLPGGGPPAIGRAGMIRSLSTTEARLVSLVGQAGIGKTHIAIEVARRVARSTPDGVWMVDLAGATDERVPRRIAATLGLRPGGDDDLLETVAASLRERSILLLLDGCEQALSGVANAVQILLDRCPGVRVLATSRQPLGLASERATRILPLEPDGPALDLFWARAVGVNPSLARAGRAARAAAAICRALGGVPLAIELAAASAGQRSPDEILRSITDHGDPSRDAIRRSIDQTVSSLTPQELILFRRLAVLPSGCQADAAIAVCAGDGLDGGDVLPALWRLVDRSILYAEDFAGVVRYRMPGIVRDEAAALLEESEDGPGSRARRVRWARDLVRDAAEHLSTPGQALWLARLDFEHDNIRASIAMSIDSDPDIVQDLTADLARYWYMHGHWREGRYWAERSIEGAADSLPVARVLTGCARLCEGLGDYAASRQMYERAITIFRALGTDRDVAMADNGLAYTLLAGGDLPAAGAVYEEARAFAERAGDDLALTGALIGRGTVAATDAHWEQAIDWCEQALPLARAIGDPSVLALTLTTLSGALVNSDRLDRAHDLLAEALQIRRVTGDRAGEAVTQNTLGVLALRRGDRPAARSLFRESLVIRRELGHTSGIATVLNNLATASDDPAEKRRVFERALELRRELGSDVMTALALRRLADAERIDGALAEARAHLLDALELEAAHDHRDGVVETLEGVAALVEAGGEHSASLTDLAARLRDGDSTVGEAVSAARALLGTAARLDQEPRAETSKV